MSDTHVLLVEDSGFMAGRVSDTLEDTHGFSVTTVKTAAEARATLEDGDYDCVVSNYELPDETGPELASSIRERSIPDVPLILFTGRPLAPLAKEALESGVTDFVSKDQHVTGSMDVLANRVDLAIRAFEPGGN